MKEDTVGCLKCMAAGVAFVVASLILWAVSTMARANFTAGEELRHNLSACLEKADALAIAKADVEHGFAAALALWEKNDKCATVPVVGPLVGKVIFTGQIEREGKKLTMRVVEILDPETKKPLGYFLTTMEVKPPGLPKPKPTDGDGISLDGNRIGRNV